MGGYAERRPEDHISIHALLAESDPYFCASAK